MRFPIDLKTYHMQNNEKLLKIIVYFKENRSRDNDCQDDTSKRKRKATGKQELDFKLGK